MFGGFYLEMVLWNIFGDFLDGIGWIIVFVEVDIVLFGVVDLFLKVLYLIRIR